jgi:predicted DNA-binding transcriptional regulator AlpA
VTQDNRIKLRPTEAAAYLNRSVANIYWKANNEPGFPKPRKFPGKRASFFYKDELDAWKARETASKQSPLTLATNPSIDTLKSALLLLGETEDSIARAYLFDRAPALPDHRPASARQPGEPGYVPPYFPEWAQDQDQQDQITLHQFAWERVWAEMQKATRLLVERPELSSNPDFAAYQRAVRHAAEVVAGRCALEPGHRVGSWPEEEEREHGNA